MSTESNFFGWLNQLDRHHLGLAVLSAIAVVLVPITYVICVVLVPFIPVTVSDTVIAALVAFLLASLVFVVGRFVGFERAARWAFGIVFVAGLYVTRVTVLSWGVK